MSDDRRYAGKRPCQECPDPWAEGERVLVCVNDAPRAGGLVGYAKQLADRLHAPWAAVHVETRRSAELSEEQRDRIADTLRSAERLGAETVTLQSGGRNVADDLIAHARSNNTTQMVIGNTARSRWHELLHR